jgi:lipopolysaccharide/colanic/teichoic acid biosynthesis glycosyltransferase
MYKILFKRLFDIIVSALLLVLFLPLLLIFAAGVKITSPGPVFFRQNRGGRGGKYFRILKFRSMTQKKESDGKDFDPGSNLRVTGFGRFLRKTKMDELPQLINVLKGEMSMVGPRPEVKAYIDLYPERWAKVLSVRPGITDPASIAFRNEENLLAKSNDPELEYRNVILPRKLDIYEGYVDSISLLKDIRVLFTTFFVVFRG